MVVSKFCHLLMLLAALDAQLDLINATGRPAGTKITDAAR